MAVMSPHDARLQFGPSRNFSGFGYNEDYCDQKYPASQSPQMAAWNAACKRGCSGFSCVSNPGLAASPWTDVGKAARGLPNDSILGTALSTIGIGGKTSSAAPPAKKPSGNIFGNTSTLLLLGSAGLLGAALFLKRKGRSRSFGDFGSPKGRKHRGYSKRRYHGSKH